VLDGISEEVLEEREEPTAVPFDGLVRLDDERSLRGLDVGPRLTGGVLE